MAGQRAGRAAFGVGLAQHDRQVPELRKLVDDLDALLHVHQVLPHPHAQVAVNHARRSLGMVADEVERRAGLAGDRVNAARAVFQELAQERRRPARNSGSVVAGPPTLAVGSARRMAVGGVVVELVVLLGGAYPQSCKCLSGFSHHRLG